MTDISYKVTLSGVDNLGDYAANILQQAMPLIDQAVRLTAEQTAVAWQDAVYKSKLWAKEKQAYIDSIQWQSTGPLKAEVWSDYDLANQIETGRPERDLKTVLQTSNKVRRVQHGKHAGQKYLIIPFRHNTPGFTAHAKDMPPHIYQQAKQLLPSRVVGQTTRTSGTGAQVPQLVYKWGGRLPQGLAPKMKPHHKTDIYAGMVKFNTSTPKAKSSAYTSFRTMGEWSDGWVVGPRPGLYLALATSEFAKKALSEAIGQAVAFSLKP